MQPEERTIIGRLLRERRQAALGTLAENGPFVSMVAFAAEDDLQSVLLLLSGLSPHTRHLRAAPRYSLLICEPETPEVEDVQTLARITLSGTAQTLTRDRAEYGRARAQYLAKLPASAHLFDFADFLIFRLAIHEARYIGGFARAYTLTPSQLAQC